MESEHKLYPEQVAKIANCHRNTVLKYEREGFISSLRDNNGFRRFTKQDALKLKQILEIRKPSDN